MIVIVIWGIAHVVNAVMNFQDMQYFKEHSKTMDKEEKALINQVNRNANPSPYMHYNPYGNLK